MTDFSLVIPYSPDHGTRTANFRWLSRYYQALFPGVDLVTGDDGHYAGQPLNRSRMRNAGVRAARHDVLVILDADALLTREAVLALVEAGRQPGVLAMLDRVKWVTPEATARVIADDPGFPTLTRADFGTRIPEQPLKGFVFACTRATYYGCGGFDEQFVGWGEEDPGFTAAYEAIFQRALQRVPHPGYHLAHSHGESDHVGCPTFAENRKRSRAYQRATLATARRMTLEATHARGALRLLFVAQQHMPHIIGGAERSLQVLCQWLQRRGHAVSIIEMDSAIPYREYEGIAVYGGAAWAQVATQVDAIILNHNVMRHRAAALAAGVPCYFWAHNEWQVDECQDFVKHGGQYLANCRHVATVMDAQGVPSAAILPPLIEEAPYRTEACGDAVLFINPIPIKGAPLFWQTVKLCPHERFLVVRGRYGVQNIPKRLPANVTVIDAEDDARAVYAQAKVVLGPSEYETWFRVGLEAGLNGIPLIARHNPGVDESMGDAVLYADTPEGFAAAIAQLNDLAAYRAASHRIRRRYEVVTAETEARYVAFEQLLREQHAVTAELAPTLAPPPVTVHAPTPPPPPAHHQVTVIATESHFLDHLLPTWQALPAEDRGPVVVPAGLAARAAAVVGADAVRVMHGTNLAPLLHLPGLLPLTAAVKDLALVHALGIPSVYSEHGAGQSYGDTHPSYSGGTAHRSLVRLFLVPNEQAAARVRAALPGATVAVVGCPKLDRWHAAPPKPRGTPPVVCLSWHWHCTAHPETRSAWDHYRQGLAPLLCAEWQLIGHAHPRMATTVAPLYQRLGIEFVADFADVLDRTDCYVCDNSSTIFEFASLDRPVVLLNAPWYRKDARHGLRFWEAADIGIQVARARELPDAIRRALVDDSTQQARRRARVAQVYPIHDGTAAQTAAAAILALPIQAHAHRAQGRHTGMVLLENLTPDYYYRGRKLARGQQFLADEHDLPLLLGTGASGTPRCRRVEPEAVDTPPRAGDDTPPTPIANATGPVVETPAIPPPTSAKHGSVTVTYACTLCKLAFASKSEQMRHFSTAHRKTNGGLARAPRAVEV